ncbi:MAG: hypothetical protein GY904_23725 [Planctomycetaceae bacterium]|nr:hypothetical protein [Planctomycetaceae bacterium]
MWSLDVSIVALAGLVLYVITTQLQFDDPRWLFNAWTYIVAVPIIALILTFLSHGLVSRHVQKSIQLGFLFSVFVHLLLLFLAINVIIFGRYFPNAFSGKKPERSLTQRTVPEYLFRATDPDQRTAPPDWTEPVDAVTTSRVKPEKPVQTPPLEKTSRRTELPRPPEPPQPSEKNYLMKRQDPSETLPKPAEAPARLAQRRDRLNDSSVTNRMPTAPNLPTQANPQVVNPERRVNEQKRSARKLTNNPTAPATIQIPVPPTPQPSIAGARNRSESVPRVGESESRQQRQSTSASRNLQPAGSSPPPQSVAIARFDAASTLQLSPSPTAVMRRGQTTGAQLTNQPQGTSGLPAIETTSSTSQFSRSQQQAGTNVPTIAEGTARRAPGRKGQRAGTGFTPAGAVNPGQSLPDGPMNLAGDSIGETISDRLNSDDAPRRKATSGGRLGIGNRSSAAIEMPDFDAPLSDGLAGLANQPRSTVGGIPSREQPSVSVLDINRGTRPRREVGGPVTPAGNQVTSVQSFSRRVMRTKGGAAPTPAGMVGPATEEAIELGLTYLAKTQNEDGSWSLQGHGTEVALQSDTAATGLCLLAFQGAGYTHLQHQYLETVNRGLQYLIRHQKASGDLYRSENQISDQNVAFYSHGIASLALCEAYGMTQDPDLKQAAQSCLNYIIDTQHRERGAWRYSPQVSSDTSVTGWMMMALKSGQLSGLEVPEKTYRGINQWLQIAQSPERPDRYRYNPFAPDTPTQRHGRSPTPTMTAVGMLMRMYSGWSRENPAMQSASEYLLEFSPQNGTFRSPQRDTYYWYYATQVMFHMGGETWYQWNRSLNPLLLEGQIKTGPLTGSWDPMRPVPDRWAIHAGRLYVTTMNLLNLEVYYRHLPIYDDTAE